MQAEIDVLTGEKIVRRTDILFDCGHSLNPGIDIGQVRLVGLSLFIFHNADSQVAAARGSSSSAAVGMACPALAGHSAALAVQVAEAALDASSASVKYQIRFLSCKWRVRSSRAWA